MRQLLEIFVLVVLIYTVQSDKESESFRFIAGAASVSTFLRDIGIVFHMEIDLYRPGNILFSTRSALHTTDGSDTRVLLGSANQPGHADGIGKSVRFNYLYGFHQIDSTNILAADRGNNCVRKIDRFQNMVTESVGICSDRKGYRNGPSSQAEFSGPNEIIADNQLAGHYLITDEGNSAIRHFDIKSQNVSTFLHGSIQPRGISQESVSGDIYLTSGKYSVFYINYKSRTLSLLTGSQYGHMDGKFSSALFYWPREIMIINHGKQLVVIDEYGPGLRLLDLETNETSTFCDKEFEAFYIRSEHPDADKWKRCDRTSGNSLLKYGDKLLVGAGRNIITISGLDDSEPTTTKPVNRATTMPTVAKPATRTRLTTTMEPTRTTQPSTSPVPDCVSKNDTMTLKPGQTHAVINRWGGLVLNFAAGQHSYTTGSGRKTCINYVTVLPAAKATTLDKSCPAEIRKIASAVLGTASVDLALTADTVQQLHLPVGSYKYQTSRNGVNCSQQVVIVDPYIVRRIVFRAHYNVKCSFLSDPLSRATLASLAESSFNEIQSVCEKDCSKRTGTEALLSCSGDKLTITWSTDKAYSGDITTIPAQLNRRLTTRHNKMSVGFLKIVVVNRQPPIVYPTKVEITLASSCQNNKFYTEKGDRCE